MSIAATETAVKGCDKPPLLTVVIAIAYLSITCYAPDCYALDPPPITPNDEFFTLVGVFPEIPPDWHLTVDGTVANPLALTLDDLAGYTPTSQMVTLACDSYTLVYPIYVWIGNANWTAVPLNTVIADASPTGETESITFHALDGYRKGPYPLSDIMERGDILVAYEMNGVPLPIGQGYPARLVVPGDEGNEWVRWLERIEFSTATPTEFLESHPVHARIFDPVDGEAMMPGIHTISGVAFVGEEREITRVEVSTDGGSSWGDAQLLNTFVPNVWQHWEFTWEAFQVGGYEIVARAEDDLANLQSENDPVYGWNTLSVDVVVEAFSTPALSGWGAIILVIAILGIGWGSVGSL